MFYQYSKDVFPCPFLLCLLSDQTAAASALPLFSVSPLSSGHDSIYYLHDAVQGGVSADGHVSTTEVVVNGAHKAYDVQVVVLLCQSVRDPS